MLILEKIFKSPRTMKAVFGLEVAKFNELAEALAHYIGQFNIYQNR